MSFAAVIFYGLNLAIGVALVYWSWFLASRHRYRFLQPFTTYQLTWVVFGFLFFVGQYALRQVPDLDYRDRYQIFQIVTVIPSPAWSLFMYMFIVWSGDLVGWLRPRWLSWAFWSLQLILMAVSLYDLAVVAPSGRHELDLLLGRLLDWVYYVQLVLLPVILLVGSRRVANPPRRRLARALGLTYLGCYLVPATSILSQRAFADGVDTFLIVQSLIFMSIGIPPLAVMHAFLSRHRLVESHETASDSFEAVLRQVDLNSRESEIVVLVARGLTNDEIAAELFISVKTVKNNISSIYRKTRLRNRVELANYLQGRNPA